MSWRTLGICFFTLKNPAVAWGQMAPSQFLRHSTSFIPTSSKSRFASSIQSRSGPVGMYGVAICVAPAREAQRVKSLGTPALNSVVFRPVRNAASRSAPCSNSSISWATGRGDRRWLVASVAHPTRLNESRSKSSGRQSSSVTSRTVGRFGSGACTLRSGITLGRPSGSSFSRPSTTSASSPGRGLKRLLVNFAIFQPWA